MPARHLGTTNETGHRLDTHSSSLYHRNLMWQQMVEAQVQRPALDPEVFSGASLPVPMVRVRVLQATSKYILKLFTCSNTQHGEIHLGLASTVPTSRHNLEEQRSGRQLRGLP